MTNERKSPIKKLPPESPFQPVEPERVVLETDSAVAILDRFPLTEGHTLVIPKRVVVRLSELPPEEEAEVWDTVRQVRDLLEERYHPDGFNIGVNDGQAAGQTIPQVHIHVIPRYRGDVPDPRGGIRWIMPEKAKYWGGK